VFADRAYDHDKYREQVQAAGITPIIGRRGTARRGVGRGRVRGRRAELAEIDLGLRAGRVGLRHRHLDTVQT
jgi:hypothetical protein